MMKLLEENLEVLIKSSHELVISLCFEILTWLLSSICLLH